MKTTWLKIHIAELLAIIAVAQFVIVMLCILFRVVKTNDTTTLMILTNSFTLAFTGFQYYFGSSKGSKDKQLQLDKQEENKPL